jgi:hypothetical protein
MARLALLVRAYEARHDRLPADLSTLAELTDEDLPVDACSGEPYHYEVTDGGFVLYSVGPDLQDDRGSLPAGTPEGRDMVFAVSRPGA